MMTKEEIVKHLEGMIGIPWKKDPPFGLQEGFSCYAFAAYVFNLAGINFRPLSEDFDELKELRGRFVKVETPQYLDVPLFYAQVLDRRHVGIMQDEQWVWQSAPETNGIARVNLRREPWSSTVKGIYRIK